jgi:hypothetical protein
VVGRYAGIVIQEALIHTIGIRALFICGLASIWNSGKGVGQLHSYTGESAVRGFLRGGSWNSGGIAGVLALDLGKAPSITYSGFGFRVSR